MRPLKPEIVHLPAQSLLTIKTIGSPNKVAQPAISALYGTAYGTKFKVFRQKGKSMEIGCLACEWPNAHLQPKSKWVGRWSLAVSSFVTKAALIQKDPKNKTKLEKRTAGTYAQILHVGPYSAVGPAIKILRRFVTEKGYALAGPHEEVYLTKPDIKLPKTIIRYRVKKLKRISR